MMSGIQRAWVEALWRIHDAQSFRQFQALELFYSVDSLQPLPLLVDSQIPYSGKLARFCCSS